VLGAPVYSGRWHRDAHRFPKRHRKELLTVPVAVFGMGPRNPGQEAWQRSRRQLDRALAKRDWLKPAAVAVSGGVDPRRGKVSGDAICGTGTRSGPGRAASVTAGWPDAGMQRLGAGPRVLAALPSAARSSRNEPIPGWNTPASSGLRGRERGCGTVMVSLFLRFR
jgi:Flavodoxin domain